MESCKAPHGVALRINFDRNVRATQLSDHRIETAHPKVNHPGLLRVPKVLGVIWKGRECSGTGRLLPHLWVNAQMKFVPGCQFFRIATSEEESADAEYAFPGICHFDSLPFRFCGAGGGKNCQRRGAK